MLRKAVGAVLVLLGIYFGWSAYETWNDIVTSSAYIALVLVLCAVGLLLCFYKQRKANTDIHMT